MGGRANGTWAMNHFSLFVQDFRVLSHLLVVLCACLHERLTMLSWKMANLLLLLISSYAICANVITKLPYPVDYDHPSNPDKSRIELNYNADLIEDFPEVLPVYRVIDPNITEEEAEKFAEIFVSTDAKKYRSAMKMYMFDEGDTLIEIDPANGYYEFYKRQKFRKKEDIHKEIDSEKALIVVEKFIKDKEILIPKGAVLEGVKEFTDKFIVRYKRTIDKYEFFGAGALIDIDVNEKGEIIRFSKAWQELDLFQQYPIKSPKAALDELINGEGYLFNGSRGELIKIKIVYYASPQKQEYVQPFYHFEFIDNNGEEFYGEVPAIKTEYLIKKSP